MQSKAARNRYSASELTTMTDTRNVKTLINNTKKPRANKKFTSCLNIHHICSAFDSRNSKIIFNDVKVTNIKCPIYCSNNSKALLLIITDKMLRSSLFETACMNSDDLSNIKLVQSENKK